MSYVIEHTRLAFCWWDLPARLVLLAVIVVFIIRRRDMKKEEKDLEEQLSDLYATDTVDSEQHI